MNYPTIYEGALAFETHAEDLVERNICSRKDARSEKKRAHLETIQALVPPGRYRHFKGGEYQVLGVREDVNTGLCYVEYSAHYGFYKDVPSLRILVGEDSFLRPIDRPEYRGVRFVLLD